MTTIELSKAYDYKSTEERIYHFWEQNGYFQPVNDPKNPALTPNGNPM